MKLILQQRLGVRLFWNYKTELLTKLKFFSRIEIDPTKKERGETDCGLEIRKREIKVDLKKK